MEPPANRRSSNSLRGVPEGSQPRLEAVRRLVLKHGWNTTAYQILNPGIGHWLALSGDAAVGYVPCRAIDVVAGAPVCGPARLAGAVAEFEADRARLGRRVCYFGAESRLESLLGRSPTHSRVLLGAQPAWDPRAWAGLVARQSSLRGQLNRARNKGVSVSEWPSSRARDHPALAECLSRWLATKGLPPLHFLVEPSTLSRLVDRRVFVAERGSEVVGFAVLSPVPGRRGWLFEQFPHAPSAPNGTVELMIDGAMHALAAGDSEYATLGLAPLSRRARIDPPGNPLWLRVALSCARAHGRRFYDFDGLDHFKAKLRPERWEPVFAIANEATFSPRMLLAIAEAFSGGTPVRTVLRALGHQAKGRGRRPG